MHKRILYIDDYKDDLYVVKTWLEWEGYIVITVSNGGEALPFIQGEPFDLYLLDNRIPGQSGIEICQYIRNLKPSAVILFFSAAAYPKDVEEGLRAGADEYLIKPNDFIRLPDVITHYLEQDLSSKCLFSSTVIANNSEMIKGI